MMCYSYYLNIYRYRRVQMCIIFAAICIMCCVAAGQTTLGHAHIRYVTPINSQGQHWSNSRVNTVGHACLLSITTMP